MTYAICYTLRDNQSSLERQVNLPEGQPPTESDRLKLSQTYLGVPALTGTIQDSQTKFRCFTSPLLAIYCYTSRQPRTFTDSHYGAKFNRQIRRFEGQQEPCLLTPHTTFLDAQ